MATADQILTLRNKLIKYDNYYHNKGGELVSDEEYDRLVDLLRSWSPKDAYFKRVGAAVKSSDKVKLNYPMPSLKKIREGKGAEEWLQNSSGKIAVLDKLDGSSGQLEQQDDLTLVSRGDGEIGRNISKLIPHIKGIPKTLLNKQAVRGELMMKESDFASYKGDFANSRALVNGAVNSSSKVHKSARDITFVVHEMVNPKLSWDKARVKLKSQGFITAYTKIFDQPSVTQLVNHLKERRDLSDYKLDGLVLIDLSNSKRVSFKVDQPAVQVVVKHVEWNISQHGIYKPRIVFKKPVTIDGRTFTYATGHNAAYIKEHRIGRNALIEIIIAGDVIPKAVGTIRGVEPEMPENFVWNANRIEAVATEQTDKEKDLVAAKRLVSACVVLGIEGVKIGTSQKLVASGIRNIADLLNASLQIINKSGIGNVNSGKLSQQVKDAKLKATHAALMEASGVWPKGYTLTKFAMIMSKYPLKTIVEKYKENKPKLRSDIAEIKGMSSVSALEFMKGLAPYIKFLKTLDFRPKASVVEEKVIKGKFTGQEFVFTKVRDKELEAYLVNNGAKIGSRVSKSTTRVIKLNKEANSDKTAKAEDLGIPVVTIAEFKKLIKYI